VPLKYLKAGGDDALVGLSKYNFDICGELRRVDWPANKSDDSCTDVEEQAEEEGERRVTA